MTSQNVGCFLRLSLSLSVRMPCAFTGCHARGARFRITVSTNHEFSGHLSHDINDVMYTSPLSPFIVFLTRIRLSAELYFEIT